METKKSIQPKKNKRIAVPAHSRTIQVDLDNTQSRARYRLMRRIFREHKRIPWSSSSVTRSNTHNHLHVTLFLDEPMPAMERLLLASILGDDPVRSLKNYCRVKNRAPAPILLFEKP